MILVSGPEGKPTINPWSILNQYRRSAIKGNVTVANKPQLAHVTTEDGPVSIYREDGQRFSPVKFSGLIERDCAFDVR